MNLFASIDPKLSLLTHRLNARLRIDRRDHPGGPSLFQERRIYWTDGVIEKGILLQPLFEEKGVNEHLWNLKAIAWHDQTYPKEWKRLRWHKVFVEHQPFEVIQQNIDSLLATAEDELTRITMDDLQSFLEP